MDSPTSINRREQITNTKHEQYSAKKCELLRKFTEEGRHFEREREGCTMSQWNHQYRGVHQ
jgi:hypothetical protein